MVPKYCPAHASELYLPMLSTSVDFIHKKCVFGEMKSVRGSVEFSGKFDRLLIVTRFGHISPYRKKMLLKHKGEKDVPCQRFFKVSHLFETIEM